MKEFRDGITIERAMELFNIDSKWFVILVNSRVEVVTKGLEKRRKLEGNLFKNGVY